jgi:hypothetical protein
LVAILLLPLFLWRIGVTAEAASWIPRDFDAAAMAAVRGRAIDNPRLLLDTLGLTIVELFPPFLTPIYNLGTHRDADTPSADLPRERNDPQNR